MYCKLLLSLLWVVSLLLAGCASQPTSQAISIATPAPLAPATATPAPTATSEPTLLPSVTETNTATPAESTPTVEAVALPAATDTPPATQNVVTPDDSDLWSALDPTAQTVIFWHRHTKYREKILNEIIDEFNTDNQYGIWVKAQSYEDYGTLFDRTVETFDTADAPNLVLGFQSDLATYFMSGLSLDLTTLLESQAWGIDAEERADFFNWAIDAELSTSLGNVRTGLPMDRAADVLFVNREWLAELGIGVLPKTPEEFRNAACAAPQQPFSKDTLGKPIGFALSDNASTFASWVFAFGGDVYDTHSGLFTLDSSEAISAWSFVQRLIVDGCAQIASERYGDQADFGNGVALFAVGASNSFYFFNKAVQDGADFQWEVAPLPYTTDKAILNFTGPSIALIKSTPEEELASWLFLKHYASTPMQAKWARAVEGFPIRGSSFEQMGQFLEENSAYQSLVPFLPDGRGEPSLPGYGFIRGAIRDAIVAIAGGADVESTLQQLNAEANAIVARQLSQ